MTSLASGSSVTVTLPIGQTLAVKAGGSGQAVYGLIGPMALTQVELGKQAVVIGPFAYAMPVYLTSNTGILNYTQTIPVASQQNLQPAFVSPSSNVLTAYDGTVVPRPFPFNLKNTNSKNWQIARANVRSKTKRARVGIIGTSLKVGQGSNSATPLNATNAQVRGPVNQLAQLLSSMGTPSVQSSFFGDGAAARYAQTLPVQDPRVTFGANWSSTFSNIQIWPGGSAITYTNGAVNNLTFTPVEAFDSVDIYYYSFASNGSFTCNVNGGATIGTVTTSTNPQNILKATFTFTRVSGGANVFNIVPSNNGGITLLGIDLYDSTVPAVSFLNFSHRGAAIGDTVFKNYNTVPGISLPVLNTYGPCDLWIISLVVNDSNQAGNFSPVFDYQARLDQLVAYLLSAGNCDVWLSTDQPSNTVFATNGTLASYIAAVYAVAAKYDIPVLDISERYVSYANNPQYYVSDGVHVTAPGYADEAVLYASAFNIAAIP